MSPANRLDAKKLVGPAVTHVAGEPAGPVQVEGLVEQHHWAALYCSRRVAAEIACGTGQGLGLLRSRASAVYECFGIIPMDKPSFRSLIFGPVKKFAVRLNVIPDSMQARQLLKRIEFGKLEAMPPDISSHAPPSRDPQPIAAEAADPVYQVVLCAGLRPPS